MARILLIHWNAAEAEEHAAALLRLGHEVGILHTAGETLRRVKEFAPEAFVISLDRMPSYGRAVAALVRNRKASRHLPIVFAGGEPGKVALAKQELPDAVFTSWQGLAKALPGALKQRVAEPVQPAMMARNPTRTLAERLGVVAGKRTITMNAPESFERTLGALPEGAEVEENGRGPADVAILFCESEAELARDFASAVRRLAPRGRLWIAWPKKTAKARSDIDMNVLRAYALARDWVDYKVCAIDGKWSGCVFAKRR
ncbi:MAG: hypothetical protein HZB13_12200 [Acidobacteria bacterium]|nr:hypothetical protein [Acidobacteriota bacterium]